jgi:hypothetical protein
MKQTKHFSQKVVFRKHLGLENTQMRQTFRIKQHQSFYFNLCATIWKLRIFEGTPAIRNSGKKSATDGKQWQISKNDLYKFDS